VHAARDETPEEAHTRELFERNVIPGTTTLSRTEMRAIPTAVEPDVLRSLQALPGMVAINDLDAQLYVRGGSADQNLFLLDGAPVYGAYHLFGMNGVFNSDAVENVDFFRGTRPARYGGALSSVVAIEQRQGDDAGTEGGLSLLGARLAQRGSFAGDRARWMVAGRRTLTDAILKDRLPFAFYDAQARLDLAPGRGHQLGLSAFTSSDRFHMFFGGGGSELASRWSNATGSLRWRSPRWMGWTASSSLWASGYDAAFRVGVDSVAPRTTDRLRAGGARFELERGTLGASLRAGAELERMHTVLAGETLDGTYFFGTADREYTRPIVWLDGERRIGPLRVAPGIRVVRTPSGGTLAEPRVGVRAQFSDDVSLTVGASRDHQLLSTLRDERTVLPGPPLWFVHPDGAPISRADALTAELTAWMGKGWSWTVGAYDRRFTDAAHWRPEGVRDLSSISYDDGTAVGVELGVRRFGQRLGGWIGYGLNRTVFTDARTGERYSSIADRRHSVNAALVYRTARRLSISAQGVYGSGLPFWPMIGDIMGPQFEPFEVFTRGFTTGRKLDVWAGKQIRMPQYARIDLGVRRSFALRGATLEPYLSVQNAAARPNVMYYELDKPEPQIFGPGNQVAPRPGMLRPVSMPWTVLPTIGFDVRF
jgi:hypothetical protein